MHILEQLNAHQSNIGSPITGSDVLTEYLRANVEESGPPKPPAPRPLGFSTDHGGDPVIRRQEQTVLQQRSGVTNANPTSVGDRR